MGREFTNELGRGVILAGEGWEIVEEHVCYLFGMRKLESFATKGAVSNIKHKGRLNNKNSKCWFTV